MLARLRLLRLPLRVAAVRLVLARLRLLRLPLRMAVGRVVLARLRLLRPPRRRRPLRLIAAGRVVLARLLPLRLPRRNSRSRHIRPARLLRLVVRQVRKLLRPLSPAVLPVPVVRRHPRRRGLKSPVVRLARRQLPPPRPLEVRVLARPLQ